MKKSLLSLGIAILFAASGQAQTEFGLEAGINFPTYTYNNSENIGDTKPLTSFYLAGYLDSRIASGVYFHPQLSLQGKGSKLIESEFLGGQEVIQKTMWVDFAFNFLAKVPAGSIGNVFAGAGPYIGFTIDGTNTYANNESTSAVIIYDDNAMKSFDYGINFLVGFKLGKRFLLNTNYRLGMANITENNYKWSDNIKNRVFSLGIGVAL